MEREGHENVDFFVGTEVEHTPAFGKKTLFVVGLQTVDDILENVHGCEHIYFGANMSFPDYDVNARGWMDWEGMIQYFLNLGYLCTLDVDVKCVEGLAEGKLVEYDNFIPMISVKMPYARLLNYNTTVKIDDKDFKATNPGVWCHSLHDLMDRSKFTDWSKYTKDELL